ncbi:uncharacterized protein GGS25DRAFT_521324 [Hypoxylon fragiforme]|uniref:uncharacterized protein n=1 Tax=Hypoxylon fragiforme TaxID=63214 RepID=UPI0020C70D28|nr:uncharacterized protein GGS25DRAFT_521324 [Hypoxylon fragiforme]KAI2608152.1 hypothetical protein GGS25DRAFT_521324 [Hypoxylon fragiforme]
MATPSLPFTTRVLRPQDEHRAINDAIDFSPLLPASYRTNGDQITVPNLESDFLAREFLVERLNAVQDWLWRTNHPPDHQILISRELVVTENPELHLVWNKNRIFLKPIPPYLLDPEFWASHILPSPNPKLASCARGFLFSYTALISYESDFRLALERGLIPHEVTWAAWQTLAREILTHHAYAAINPRYWYGELRLSRLNKIYRVRKGFVLRGYSSVAAHAVYVDLIRDNFGTLATILGYVVIVLTAMQVGLGVERLQEDEAFQSVSYGFTVFSIIAPLVAGMGIILAVLVMFVSNWLVTKDYEGKRFREMGVEAFWRKKGEGKGKGKTDVPSLSGKDSRSNSNERDV